MWNQSVWFSLFASTAAKSVALLGTAYIFAKLLARRSAASRHIVWTAAFLALLALPILSILLPRLHIAIDPSFVPSNAVFQTAGSAERSPTESAAKPTAINVPNFPSSQLNWPSLVLLL